MNFSDRCPSQAWYRSGSGETDIAHLRGPLFHRHLPPREQLREMRERDPVPIRVYRIGVEPVRHPAGTVDNELAGLQNFGLLLLGCGFQVPVGNLFRLVQLPFRRNLGAGFFSLATFGRFRFGISSLAGN